MKLKHCPFCGNEAEEYETYFGDTKNPDFTVICKNDYCGVEIGWHDTQDEANELWNNRVKRE